MPRVLAKIAERRIRKTFFGLGSSFMRRRMLDKTKGKAKMVCSSFKRSE